MKKLIRMTAREVSMKYVYGIDLNKLWDEDLSDIDASTESLETYADDIDEFDLKDEDVDEIEISGDSEISDTEKSNIEDVYGDEFEVEETQSEESSSYETEDENEENILYINTVVSGVKQHKDEIDRLIEENSRTWKINRFSKIDLAILRVAVFEIMYINKIYKNDDESKLLFDHIPYRVAINEAVRVAKKYGTKESSKFVNGILGGIVRSQGIA